MEDESPLPSNQNSSKRNAYGNKKHLQSLQEFQNTLQAAVDQACPTATKPYGQVAVLAFHFANDDIGVTGLEDELCQLFKNIYKFNVEQWEIPNNANMINMSLRIVNFLNKWQAPDALLIIVYSGHGGYGTGLDFSKYMLAGALHANGRMKQPILDWNTCSMLLRQTQGDLLLIFDSCYASATAVRNLNNVGFEVLAASAWDSVASTNLNKCFTRQLINALKSISGKSASVAQIYQMIHEGAWDNHPVGHQQTAPLHITNKGKDSIILAPLPRLQKPATHEQRVDEIASQPVIGRQRVLISVNLLNTTTIPDVEQWTRWLTSHMPSCVDSIKVEGVFESDSTLLLVTLPLHVWTMLPVHEESLNFLSFVTSSNLQIAQQPIPAQAALSLRPNTDENIPPSSSRKPK